MENNKTNITMGSLKYIENMYKIKEFEEKQQEVKNEFDDKDFFEDTTDDSSLFADTDIAQFLKNYNERQV